MHIGKIDKLHFNKINCFTFFGC